MSLLSWHVSAVSRRLRIEKISLAALGSEETITGMRLSYMGRPKGMYSHVRTPVTHCTYACFYTDFYMMVMFGVTRLLSC